MANVNGRTSTPSAVYLQASDSTDQTPGVTTPVQVTMNTTDASSGITHSSGTVTIVSAGVYFIVAAAQVGVTVNTSLEVDMWFRKNDVDITNSNTRHHINTANETAVLVCQTAERLAVGDTIKIYQSVTNATKGGGIHASAPSGEPAIPSIIFTMYRVGA